MPKTEDFALSKKVKKRNPYVTFIQSFYTFYPVQNNKTTSPAITLTAIELFLRHLI